MDTAYIKNATITSAKISELIADKIETGNLIADLQVMNKLWYGFNLPNGVYYDKENNTYTAGKTGFYLGVDGSNGLPVLHLNTGIANGSKSLFFDGIDLRIEKVNLISSADGKFDDLSGDSVDFERANFDFLAFGEHVTASQYVYDNDISISEPEFNNYLCYPNGCNKTKSWTSNSLVVGTGYTRPFAFFQTGYYEGVFSYDYSNPNTRYRANKKKIGFSVLVDINEVFSLLGRNSVGNYYGGHYLDIYILSEAQSLSSSSYNSNNASDGVPSEYLLKIPVTNHTNGTVTAYKNTGSGDVAVFDVNVGINLSVNPNQTLIVCDDDLEVLGYEVGRNLKVAVVFKGFFQAGFSDDRTTMGQIIVSMEIRSAASESSIPKNDQVLSITPDAGMARTFVSLTPTEMTALNALIQEKLNYRKPL